MMIARMTLRNEASLNALLQEHQFLIHVNPGTGQSTALDAGGDEAVALLHQGDTSAPSLGGPHAGDPSTTCRNPCQSFSSRCSLEGSRTDVVDHQRWSDALPSMGRIDKDPETDNRCQVEHPGDAEMCGEPVQAGKRPNHNFAVPRPHKEQGEPGQSSALVMAGIQPQSTGDMVRGASTLLSRHLAVGSMSGPATDLREISAGQTDPATPELRVVRILLNHKNLCYANSLIICLAWAAILMGGIDLRDWPCGGYEMFRTFGPP